MATVNKINPVVEYVLNKPLNFFSNRKIVKRTGTEGYNHNRRFIDGLGVASIVAKDGLGCYLYVTQSMNNKDIPDDKRKFVAALDLTNGLLMIAFQILMFFTVSNKVFQTKMFNKAFGKVFNNRPLKKMYQQILKNKEEYKNIDGIEFTKKFENFGNQVKDVLGALTSLAAATIIGKRMLVPFIATPLAGKVEKKMNEHSAKKENAPKQNGTDNSINPTMKGSAQKVPVTTAAQPTVIPIQVSSDNADTNLLNKYRNNLRN